jgi:hypothetical protein
VSRSERPFLAKAEAIHGPVRFDRLNRALRNHKRSCCGRPLLRKGDLVRHNELFHKEKINERSS